MLVLTRKIGQEIILYDKVTGEKSSVKVLGLSSNGQIRLGIEALDHMLVDRSEVFEKRQKSDEFKAKIAINSIRSRIKSAA